MFATLINFGQKFKASLVETFGDEFQTLNVGSLVHEFHADLAPHISRDLTEANSALQIYLQQNNGNPEKTTPDALFIAGIEWARTQAYAVANAGEPIDTAIEVAQDVVDVANKAVAGDAAGAVETALSDAAKLLTPEQVANAKPDVDIAKAPANVGTPTTTVQAPVSADSAILKGK